MVVYLINVIKSILYCFKVKILIGNDSKLVTRLSLNKRKHNMTFTQPKLNHGNLHAVVEVKRHLVDFFVIL